MEIQLTIFGNFNIENIHKKFLVSDIYINCYFIAIF